MDPMPVGAADGEAAHHVVKRRDDEPSPDEEGVLDAVGALGHGSRPGGPGSRRVHGGHPAARGVEEGKKVEHRALVSDEGVFRVEGAEEAHDRAVQPRGRRVDEVDVEDRVPGLRVLVDREHQVASVIRDLAGAEPIRVVLHLEDEPVGGLVRPEHMVVCLAPGKLAEQLVPARYRGIAVVEEAAAVLGPREVRKLHPTDDIGQVRAACHVAHVELLPVGARRRKAVAEEPAVEARRYDPESHRPVRGEEVGVHEDAGVPLPPLCHIEDRLVLQAVVLRVEQEPVALLGQAVLREVPEAGKPRLDRGALGDGLQGVGRERALGGHPRLRLRRVDGLHPAVGVRHLLPEVIVWLGVPPRRRIVGAGGA